MGYTIKIGNAIIDLDKEYGYVSVDVEEETHENAPAFNEPTDNTNSRWPSYLAWHDAMKFVGLHDLFFDKYTEPICLIYKHPGTVAITKHHQSEIHKAYESFYKKYPNCKAGYSPKIDHNLGGDDPDWPTENNYATRLEWLKYWIDWAIENCEYPVFYNS